MQELYNYIEKTKKEIYKSISELLNREIKGVDKNKINDYLSKTNHKHIEVKFKNT